MELSNRHHSQNLVLRGISLALDHCKASALHAECQFLQQIRCQGVPGLLEHRKQLIFGVALAVLAFAVENGPKVLNWVQIRRLSGPIKHLDVGLSKLLLDSLRRVLGVVILLKNEVVCLFIGEQHVDRRLSGVLQHLLVHLFVHDSYNNTRGKAY